MSNLLDSKMKIGIIVAPFLIQELNKGEIIDIETLENNEKVCTKNLTKELILDDDKNAHFLTSDVLVINYLKCKSGDNVHINVLNPLNMTEEDLEENHLNFILTFNIVEAFHNFPRKKYNEFKKLIETAPNVYPNMEFQDFIDYKDIYYTYLKRHNINVQDFYVIKKSDHFSEDLAEFFTYKKANNWGNYIIKPLYGQEGIGFSMIDKKMDPVSIEYKIEQLFQSDFPGIVFQKEIVPKFSKKSGKKNEYRTYFIGEKYIYMTAEEWQSQDDEDAHIHHTYDKMPDAETKKVIDFATGVIKIIPRIIIQKSTLKYLLLRVDITYDNNDELVVSEIEYVPSLHIGLYKNPEFKKLKMHHLLGDEILSITYDYMNKQMVDSPKISLSGIQNNVIYFIILLSFLLVMIVLFFLINKISWKSLKIPFFAKIKKGS